jgi:ribosomal protein S18 acetylase RimI-like enzyme
MVHLPTGQEPPAGFEQHYMAREAVPQPGTVTIDYVYVSQLASFEKREIANMRTRASRHFEEQTGKEAPPATLDETLDFTPEGKTTSDKLVFRAYSGKYLAGYAEVICDWPSQDQWTIMTLIIDPSFRDVGIGRQLIVAIEETAKAATIAASHIFAVPTQVVDPRFWSSFGYCDEARRLSWTIGEETYDLVLLRKAL